jgi:hypothetical protein
MWKASSRACELVEYGSADPDGVHRHDGRVACTWRPVRADAVWRRAW